MGTLHDVLNTVHSRDAEKLSVPRKINGVDFDGTKDIDIDIDGGADATSIGGIPVSLTPGSQGDVLQYLNNVWTNTNQEKITDGGNF